MKPLDSAQTAEIVQDRLMHLGVSASMARFYVYLLQVGPQKVSQVAAALGISRDEGYRAFAALSSHGYASATLTRPMMCVPADLNHVLKILYRSCNRRTAAVREASRKLAPLLGELQGATDASQDMPFRILNGRDKAYDLLHEMLSGATREMIVLNSHVAAAQLATQTGLWRRVQQRADIGLKIRILMSNTPSALRHIRQVDSPNCEVRLMELEEGLRFAITDQRSMLFFSSMDPSPWLSAPDTAISTEAVDFLNAERTLFWSLWEEAEPA